MLTSVFDTLKRICDACWACQELHAQTFHFRVSIPEDSRRFNAKLSMNLVSVNKRPVMLVLYIQILYQNTTFIAGKSSRDLWMLFMSIWDTV